MSEIEFSNNFRDMSESTGFQFEFYCGVCGDAWRTEFVRYGAGTASQLLGGVGGLLGGILGSAGGVVDTVRDAGYKSAHDRAFADAIEQAKSHFNRCRRCHVHVCAQCYNPNLHLCTNCAPSIEDESNQAARETEVQMARERSQSVVRNGAVETDGLVVCESCGARVKPTKFCSECGGKLSVEHVCGECGAKIEGSPKFCPDCGAKQ